MSWESITALNDGNRLTGVEQYIHRMDMDETQVDGSADLRVRCTLITGHVAKELANMKNMVELFLGNNLEGECSRVCS